MDGGVQGRKHFGVVLRDERTCTHDAHKEVECVETENPEPHEVQVGVLQAEASPDPAQEPAEQHS